MLVFKVLFYILHLCLWVSLGGDKLIVGLFAVVILALRVPLFTRKTFTPNVISSEAE